MLLKATHAHAKHTGTVIVTFVELNFVKYLGIALIVETAGILYIVLTQVITSNVN